MEKVIKTFVSQIRSVNQENKTLEAVISDETIDRYGEVIAVDAWKKRLKRFKEQPVLLSSHRYDKLTNQIGEAERVYVDGNQLVAKFKYYAGEGNEEADWGWKLASKFGRAAYSVGFIPYDSEDADEKDYDDVKAGKKARRTYKDVELLEVSQVLIPANPSARLKSLEDEEDVVIKEYVETINKDLEDEIEKKPDTEGYVHIGVDEGKHGEHKMRTISISASQGIQAHYCVDCKKVTGYLFDKKKGWTHEKAAIWVKEHSKSVDELDSFTETFINMDMYIDEKEEEMKEILEAITKLTEKVDALQKQIEEKARIEEEVETKLDEETKAAEEAAKKALEDEEMKKMEEENKRLEEEKKAKEEEENYIKSLMAEATDMITKIADKISVQS
jgi:hypothetical protein